MSTKWAVAVLAVIVILLAWWGVAYYSQNNPQPAPQTAQQRIPPADTHYTPPVKLTVHHSVVAGANVYSGMLPIRSCNTFSGGLSTSGGDPVHVALNFRVLDGDGTCLASTAAEDTPQPFSMSFSSTAKTSKTPVVDSVTINGAVVPFTIVESK